MAKRSGIAKLQLCLLQQNLHFDLKEHSLDLFDIVGSALPYWAIISLSLSPPSPPPCQPTSGRHLTQLWAIFQQLFFKINVNWHLMTTIFRKYTSARDMVITSGKNYFHHTCLSFRNLKGRLVCQEQCLKFFTSIFSKQYIKTGFVICWLKFK